MRTRNKAVLVVALLAAGVVPAVAGQATGQSWTGIEVDGSPQEWRGQPTMVPGTASYDKGVWSFTDYPYDDLGTGAFAYPAEGNHGDNSADPVVVQISADEHAVHHLIRLDTLLEPTTVVAFAIDTDGDATTGGGAWPRNAKARSAGWDVAVTTWGTGAVATFADGREVAVPTAFDLTENTIEVAVPRTVADPGSGTWRYFGGAGIWDGTTNAWAEVVPTPGTGQSAPPKSPTGKADAAHPNLFNLLFRSRQHDGGSALTDENNSGGFQRNKQETALRTGDVSAFGRAVDFGLLATGATVVPEEPAGDVHITRVYESPGFPNAFFEGRYPSMSLEGMDIDGTIFNGRYQPYRMFVPVEYRNDPSPAPMLPLLHGWGGDHHGFKPAASDFWTKVVRPNRALVPKPLGAGQRVWYEHLGELDVLAVMQDVAANYNVDADRVYLGGVSMGGLGTVKIAEAHPDLFAGIFPSVPPMSDRATGYAVPAGNEWDLVEHVDSLRNVPVRNFTGTYDALVTAGNDSRRFCDRLKRLVYDHDCWRDIHPSTGTHTSFDNPRANEIAALMAQHPRRVLNPARVTYEVSPVWVQQAATKGIERALKYDRAYWVSGITYAKAQAPGNADCRALPEQHTCFGEIDIRTFGRGEGPPVATPIADDPSPTLVRDGIVLTPGPGVPARNHFEATVANVTGFDLDLDRMALRAAPNATLTADLTNPGLLAQSLRLTLVGTSGPCTATLGGAAVPTTRHGNRLQLDLTLAAGKQALAVTCKES